MWDMQRYEESKHEYYERRREANKEMAKARNKAYDELYEGFDTKEGEHIIYTVPFGETMALAKIQ